MNLRCEVSLDFEIVPTERDVAETWQTFGIIIAVHLAYYLNTVLDRSNIN